VEEERTAERERVTHFAGRGCLIQAVGLAAPVAFYFLFAGLGALMEFPGEVAGSIGVAIGLVALLVLFVKGSAASVTWRCGYCKNPIADKRVLICPVCKSNLE
jgi:hypothetical protein